MKYCALLFRLVTIQIQSLTQLPKNTPKAPKLAEIVCLHNSAFEATQLAEDILNISLMMQFMSTVMFWCLTMFYASTNINISLCNVLILFFLSLVETYGYSYLGQQITDEAAAVESAIYDLPWYDESVELQNSYRMILRRSQHEVGITAAKFFIVGLEQFGKISQMSYSYYLVLKDSLASL
ncbi:odorant receptor 4-like [Toxorhynchites rutilus septentrionalis]|uniref:odorant receptor 4-like n=1 Tax=Toxorhynchites rutilus septentrionalis TaxID=329112 RepID=UPI002479E8D0|nr:odorant receptor 4-like [Toxorhynchites rutilus septentrionalis]